jgi:hypothetical protein
MGREGSISFIVRLMCSMLAPALELAATESAGTNSPPSRKDLMLDMRSRDDAEGDRRMMGSGRRGFWCEARAGFEEMLFVEDGGAEEGFFDMRGAASLRTWEKSYKITGISY